MRADYDSEGDTLAIELTDVDRADYGDDETHPQAVVAILDDQPVIVDVIGARDGVEEPLAAVVQPTISFSVASPPFTRTRSASDGGESRTT